MIASSYDVLLAKLGICYGHGILIGIQWDFKGISLGFHGIPLGFHGISIGFHGGSMGFHGI